MHSKIPNVKMQCMALDPCFERTVCLGFAFGKSDFLEAIFLIWINLNNMPGEVILIGQ